MRNDIVLIKFGANALVVGVGLLGDLARETLRVIEKDEGDMRGRNDCMGLLLRQNRCLISRIYIMNR